MEGTVHSQGVSACVVVSVNNIEKIQVLATLPPGCIPLFPKHIGETIALAPKVNDIQNGNGMDWRTFNRTWF